MLHQALTNEIVAAQQAVETAAFAHKAAAEDPATGDDELRALERRLELEEDRFYAMLDLLGDDDEVYAAMIGHPIRKH